MSPISLKQVKITGNKKIGQQYYRISFHSPDIARSAKPGQFINVKLDNRDDPLLRRPLSIHDAYGSTVELLYAVVGKGTEVLSQKKTGDPLNIIGPLGNGFDESCACAASPVLVAGGMGVAPLYFLAKRLKHKDPLVLVGARNRNELMCVKELKALGLGVYVSTDDGSAGKRGYVTDLLRSMGCGQVVIYACGPQPMLREISEITHQTAISVQVSLEEHMSCGFGACLGCVVKTTAGYKRVCKEGPVFDARQIVWNTNK
jgi:dihydroorotate dehydrogenase electron transfer subunit